MHTFYEYLSQQIEKKIRERRVVVFYDPRSEFFAFVDELSRTDPGDGGTRVALGERAAHLLRYEGSFFALRTAAEALTAGEEPEPVLLYLPGVTRDRKGSILMELELGGELYEPQLKRLALNVLRQRFTDGQIDVMLRPEKITYEDVVSFLRQGEEDRNASVLRGLFSGAKSEVLLARWLADTGQDAAIVEKEATHELLQLLAARLGLELREGTSVAEAREKTARYVLVGEFRSDLSCEPPSSIAMVPEATTGEHRDNLRELASRLRRDHAKAYESIADRVAGDLGLAEARTDARHLGSIDTFRFEERHLLAHAGELIAEGRHAEALAIVMDRNRSFWVDRDVERQRQWGACRLMADLGAAVERVAPALSKAGKAPSKWIEAYTAADGWYEADRAQRALETWIATMDEEPENDRALGIVRRAHEDLLRRMAEGFTGALREAGWSVSGVTHQTRVWPEYVERGAGARAGSEAPRSVALFLVDALRYEMGVELACKLQGADELEVRPAVAALPSITPVGMAALLPGASAGFSVVRHKGKLTAEVDGVPLADWQQRWKYLQSRVPGVEEMTLGRLLSERPDKLAKALESASLVLVRSKEIDFSGETSLLPWQVMDIALANLARAVRKLSAVGVEGFVITADHGHQFAIRKEEDMRTDQPGGDTVGIHRRCWIGCGGATPPGTVRVSGSELGYATDLDFVFPTGLGVFKTSGGLSYHHGGTSLQEMVIPVVSLRIPSREVSPPGRENIRLEGVPGKLTNRTFGVKVFVEGDLFSETSKLRVILISEGEQVGQAGIALGGELDGATGILTVEPQTEVSVAMILTADDCPSVRLVVQDPSTDRVLAESEEIPVKLGI